MTTRKQKNEVRKAKNKAGKAKKKSSVESNDLTEATTMKPKEPLLLTGPVSDLADNDPTNNTQAADDLIPNEVSTDEGKTNEQMAQAMADQIKAEEGWKIEVTISEASLWLRDVLPGKLKEAGDKVLDYIVNKYIAFDKWAETQVDKLYSWAYKTNQEFAAKWAEWFPKKNYVTHAEFVAGLEAVATKLATEFKTQQRPKVDVAKLNELLIAHSAGQKVKMIKLYSEMTGLNMAVSKNVVEAFA